MLSQLMQIFSESLDVALIQGRLNLVKETEGLGLEVLNREEKRYCSQCLLTTRQLHHILKLLTRWLSNNSDSRIENILILHKLKGTVSATEELLEYLVEFLLDCIELLLELLTHGMVKLFNDTYEGLLCFYKIIMLGL